MATKPKKRRKVSLSSPKKAREIYSTKLTSKYQATVPREIRKRLRLKKGDRILYEVLHDDSVLVRKTTPVDLHYLQAIESTLSEWESEEDERAYKNL